MTRTIAALALCVFFGGAARASAQAVHLDHYRSAEATTDGFGVSRPNDYGHLRFGARVDLDYAFNPLVFEAIVGDPTSERFALVEHQLAAQLGVGVGLFDRVLLYAGLPINLVMDGASDPRVGAADGASVSDARLGGRVRLFGESDDMFGLALQLGFTLPSAQGANAQMRFAGEDGVVVHPEAVAEVRFAERVRVSANVGARIRATDRARLPGLAVSHEFTYALAVGVQIIECLEATLEIWGSSVFEDFGDRETSPLETIVGLLWNPRETDLTVGLAGGLGLLRGYGSPDFRGVLTVGIHSDAIAWGGPERARRSTGDRAAVGSAGRDGVGRTDDEGGTTGTGGTGPDATSDAQPGGGAVGARTARPRLRDDRDGDGIIDSRDGAPDDPEDPDGFQDGDGVPDPDNDGDGTLDPYDGCPIAPGPPENHGCLETVRVDEGQIIVLQRVEFETGGDAILERSEPVLEDVRAILAANPQLERVLIEGHTDDRGEAEANLDLSVRRARSVVRWLVAHGIAEARLRGAGCGETHARETNATAAGRQANRRVEVHILVPVPEGGARQLEGCVEVSAD